MHARNLVALLLLASCTTQPRRFALRDPVWVDDDKNHVLEEPSEFVSGLMADGADQMFFRPLSRVWTFPLPEEAWNVNAVDEVPNSSWFQNRIGLFDVPPEVAAQGACGDSDMIGMHMRVDDVANRLRRCLDVPVCNARSRLGPEADRLVAQVELILQATNGGKHLLTHRRQTAVDHQHTIASDRHGDVRASPLQHVEIAANG
jgi:hypothetical protein